MVIYIEEIRIILKKGKRPMTSREITDELIGRRNIIPRSRTPGATVSARIVEEIKFKKEKSLFKKTPKGYILNK